MNDGNIVLSVISYVIGILVLYAVIESAVRRGINRSVLGQYLDKKHGIKEENTSFLKDDLDKD